MGMIYQWHLSHIWTTLGNKPFHDGTLQYISKLRIWMPPRTRGMQTRHYNWAFNNLGATCYLNGQLQCLDCMPPCSWWDLSWTPSEGSFYNEEPLWENDLLPHKSFIISHSLEEVLHCRKNLVHLITVIGWCQTCSDPDSCLLPKVVILLAPLVANKDVSATKMSFLGKGMHLYRGLYSSCMLGLLTQDKMNNRPACWASWHSLTKTHNHRTLH